MSSRDQIDERFDEIVFELRAGRTPAPEELRERVAAMAAEVPIVVERPRLAERFRLRRAFVVLVPACLALAASAALLQGFVSAGNEAPTAAAERGRGTLDRDRELHLAPRRAPADPAADTVLKTRAAAPLAPVTSEASALPPGQRLVDYRVSMRLRVGGLKDLSNATVAAMRTARRLGGYVASVRYSSPSVRDGGAVLVLRVPVARVQQAILGFSDLGTIVAQSVSLTDLQKLFDRQVARLAKLRKEIVVVQGRLANEELEEAERARLQGRLEYLRAELDSLTRTARATERRGRYATARLAFVTHRAKQAKKVVPPAKPSRFDRTLDEAGSILAKELAWGLYGLIVIAPLLVLALIAYVLGTSRRRRFERRLLARA